MDRSIDVEMTSRLVWRGLFYQLRAVIFVMTLMLLATSWRIIMFVQHGLPSDIHVSWETFLTPGLLLLFVGWAIFFSYRNTMSQIKKMKIPAIHYRFTDDYLYISSDLASGQNTWAVFKGLQKHSKIWRIVTQSGLSFILPVELLDEELKAFLTTKLHRPTKPIWKRPSTVIAALLILMILVMFFAQKAQQRQEETPKASDTPRQNP